MSERERKLWNKICTWAGCDKPGVHYHPGVDEFEGSPLLLCIEHDKLYVEKLKQELENEIEYWSD